MRGRNPRSDGDGGAFTVFTLLAIILLRVAGMPPWDAINHGMTGLSTGGFAVTDNSIATYGSRRIQVALLPIYYLLLRGRLEGFARDRQTQWLLLVIACGTTLAPLIMFTTDSLRSTAHDAITVTFQFVSAITCTDFSTTNLGSMWSRGRCCC
ncbi:potassium transporter TrkG [Natrialba taiwanensis]